MLPVVSSPNTSARLARARSTLLAQRFSGLACCHRCRKACFSRAVARLPLFRKEADYAAFERVMLEAYERHPTRILAWCLNRPSDYPFLGSQRVVQGVFARYAQRRTGDVSAEPR